MKETHKIRNKLWSVLTESDIRFEMVRELGVIEREMTDIIVNQNDDKIWDEWYSIEN
jgi:hypothetical protein